MCLCVCVWGGGAAGVYSLRAGCGILGEFGCVSVAFGSHVEVSNKEALSESGCVHGLVLVKEPLFVCKSAVKLGKFKLYMTKHCDTQTFVFERDSRGYYTGL